MMYRKPESLNFLIKQHEEAWEEDSSWYHRLMAESMEMFLEEKYLAEDVYNACNKAIALLCERAVDSFTGALELMPQQNWAFNLYHDYPETIYKRVYILALSILDQDKAYWYQVNVHRTVDGDAYADITDYSEDGYVGELTDTIYEDGEDYTDWCVFCGPLLKCQRYIRQRGL